MFWLAFTTGLLGSLHCVGMCGPIALAIPMKSRSKWRLLFNASLYNGGRTFMYVLLGLLLGIIGEGFGMAGLQKGLSVGIGILLLVVVFFSINLEKRLLQIPILGRLFFQLKISLANYIKQPSTTTIFFTGFLNGLLPCGLVYIALAGALATGTLLGSLQYMLLFGIGTIPLLFLTILIGNQSTLPLKKVLQKAYPVFLTILGCWFIYRGIYIYLPAEIYLSDVFSLLPMCY